MPLRNDLWALCRLILLSTHYVARPSVAGRWWGGKGVGGHPVSLCLLGVRPLRPLAQPSLHSSAPLHPFFFREPLRRGVSQQQVRSRREAAAASWTRATGHGGLCHFEKYGFSPAS